MAYGLSHLQHASRIGADHTWYFNRIDEWASKRDAIIVLQTDMPAMLLAVKNRPTVPHPTNASIQTFDPTIDIRLMIACESIVNCLYSAAEIAANFANLASKGTIPNSFNRIRQKCEGDNPPEYYSILGDLQWYRKVRELRTEWAHFSSIFLGQDENGDPLLCIKSFRRSSDRREFSGERTFCHAIDLCDWVGNAAITLERFAGFLLSRYVIPSYDPELMVVWFDRDELGFPKILQDGGISTTRIPYREYLRRGGIAV